MKRSLLVMTLLLALWGVAPRDAGANPHGCASVSRDHKVQFDPRTRSLGVELNVDEPCTFIYAEGDTYSGSGRFKVSCESGGVWNNPDYYDNGEKYPPMALMPIPQPCEVGDKVTLDGYRTGSGGGVIGGGASPWVPEAPALPDAVDYRPLCNPGTETFAKVSLRDPINYSGQLTYGGSVSCLGADVRITSLTATPLFEYPRAAAGQASCVGCLAPLTLEATVPAQWWIFEVEMDFEVTRAGVTVHGHRVGRYTATWAGHVEPICPTGDAEACPI